MKDKLRRLGWLMLVMLFIVTGLGVGVYGFWQATHPQSNPQSQSDACSLTGAISESVQPAPEPYKPEAEITQLVASDLESGSGRPVQAGDCLTVKYYGSLSDGTVFDENFTKPLGLQFLLGQGQVIPGWDQGLVGMQAGGTRRLLIPPSLGYGSQSQGSIPANSSLIFVVNLISIK